MSDQTPHYSHHIVEGIMPSLEMDLVAGPPGIGKTQLMLQILPAIAKGERVFGYPTNPTKSVFVSCDRGERSILRRLDHLGLPHYPDPGSFPFSSSLETKDGNDYTLETIMIECKKRFPDHPLLFIDGMGALVGESKEYYDVQRFLTSGTRLCLKHNITVIGSVHSPKTREGQTYSNPREQVLGSQAWVGFSDLLISVQPGDPKDPSSNRRLVHVCSRSTAGDFTVKMILSNGILVVDDSIERELYSLLDEWLKKQDHVRIIPTREIILYGVKECSLYERAIERWIEEKVDAGTLERVSRGKYKRKLEV